MLEGDVPQGAAAEQAGSVSAAACQRVPTVASGPASGEARNVPHGGGGWPVGGEISLHRESERRGKDLACPAYLLPKQGVAPP